MIDSPILSLVSGGIDVDHELFRDVIEIGLSKLSFIEACSTVPPYTKSCSVLVGVVDAFDIPDLLFLNVDIRRKLFRKAEAFLSVYE